MTLYVGECRRCGAQWMSFDVYGVSTVEHCEEVAYPPHYLRYRRTIEMACRCHECDCTTVFVLRAEASSKFDLPPTDFNEYQNPTTLGYAEIGALPHKQPHKTPEDTPEPAANFYHQAVLALAHGLHDAAGAMFRKCLESVTRTDALLKMIPEPERGDFRKLWLKARITKLKDLHAIPPALADLVDTIKDEGDGAVHNDALYDNESAEALQQFTAAFLEQTFTIPAQIARIRKKKK